MSYHLSRFAKTIASYLDIFMTAAQTISCRHKSDFNYRTCSFFLSIFTLSAPVRHTFPEPGSRLQPVMADRHGILTPARFSGRRPHCVIPWSKGAVTGRKYHDRLFRSLRDGPATGHFQNRSYSLCTFDVILLTEY